MRGGGRSGYLASYVGAVAPIAASTLLVVLPLAVYTRSHSSQLELGGLFFVFFAFAALLGGIILVPVGIYVALTVRGHREAGRTAWAVVVVAFGVTMCAYVGGLVGQAAGAGKVPADVASVVFVLGLVLSPFLARWYVVRYPKSKEPPPLVNDVVASG
jgi:hypothetical protein